MSATFRDYQRDARPAFHGGRSGFLWSLGLGLLKDATGDAARHARRQRWISVCAEDALALHGRFRGWSRVTGETVDQYRARLLNWWRLSQLAGTAKGITESFKLLGLTNVTIREALDPTWGRYAGTAKQRWFSVIVRQPHPFGVDFSFRYGDGTRYGTSKTYGANGDASLLTAMREIVRRMKPAHAYCPEIIVVLAGDIIDAGGATDGNPLDASSRVAYLPII